MTLDVWLASVAPIAGERQRVRAEPPGQARRPAVDRSRSLLPWALMPVERSPGVMMSRPR